MNSPYTTHPADAFAIAQTATAVALTAIILYRPLRPRVASVLFLCAVWLTATFPDSVAFVSGLGAVFPGHFFVVEGLRFAAFLVTVALVVARPHWVGAIALAGEIFLYWLSGYLVDSDQELMATHLALFGALLGVHQLIVEIKRDRQGARAPAPFHPNRFVRQDIFLGALSVVLASVVSTFVLLRSCDSADEWSYAWQAAVFAKLHAWSKTSPCSSAFEMYWVFTSEGRSFSQYTPGWPLFMAPFAAVGEVWLAGPFSLGVLVVGVARLARRAAAGASAGNREVVALAGPIAALVTMASNTVLLNGGSRFSHVFVCACFAWAVESLVEIVTPRPERQETELVAWGVVLGLSSSWLLTTRPGDGGMLGIGLFLAFVIAFVRRRLAWKPLAGATAAFLLWGGLTLVILHAQLGRWFVTGYSLTSDFHPWAKFALSLPKPNELHWSIPLATGSYCWWPLAPALGLGGLVAALRPGSRALSFTLVVGTMALLAFYSLSEFGRGWDFGYGPRFELPVIVAMAVGTAVMLGPLFAAARARVHSRRALQQGGPALLVIASALYGVVRLAPLIYPYNYDDVHTRNSINRAIQRDHLKNAIVWIVPGTTFAEVTDLTQNYPLDLYPAPDVVLAIDTGDTARRCVTSLYPRRKQYRTGGGVETALLPE